jgi:hypothetical protein
VFHPTLLIHLYTSFVRNIQALFPFILHQYSAVIVLIILTPVRLRCVVKSGGGVHSGVMQTQTTLTIMSIASIPLSSSTITFPVPRKLSCKFHSRTAMSSESVASVVGDEAPPKHLMVDIVITHWFARVAVVSTSLIQVGIQTNPFITVIGVGPSSIEFAAVGLLLGSSTTITNRRV